MRYKSGEGELGCFSGPTVNCECVVTGKAEFECRRGVENNACVISLNRFETTSRGGFGESGSIRIQ